MSGRVPVTMPRRWRRVRGAYLAPGVHGSGLAPRLEHRAEPFDGSLAAWTEQVGLADTGRPAYDLEDEDVVSIGDQDLVYRRFGHAVSGVAALSDQWLWVADGLGHQLLGTVAAVEYLDYCDVFESVAETVDPAA